MTELECTRRALLAATTAAFGCNVARVYDRKLSRRFDRRGYSSVAAERDGDSVRGWLHSGSGGGSPLALIHGFGGAPLFQWQHQLEPASGWGPVAVPQLLWFGGSSSTNPDPSLTHQATAMWNWLDAIGFDRPTLVGVSYGGFVSLEMCRLRPRAVSGLVLADSPGTAWSRREHNSLLQRFDAKKASDIFIPSTAQGVRTLLSLAMSKPPKMPDFAARDVIEHDYDPTRESLRALLGYLENNLERLQRQTLAPLPRTKIIWGADDTVFPVASAQALAQTMNASLSVLPGARHLSPVDAPDGFNRALREFLRASGAPASASRAGTRSSTGRSSRR